MHEFQNLITLTQAAKLLPGRPSVNCVWRWCRKGLLSRNLEHIHLKHVRMGGKIYTRREWLAEFGQAIANADTAYYDQQSRQARAAKAYLPKSKTDSDQKAAIARAEERLRAAGLKI